jgi:hypothetical protein
VTGKASGQELLWIQWKYLEKALAISEGFTKCIPSFSCGKLLTTFFQKRLASNLQFSPMDFCSNGC